MFWVLKPPLIDIFFNLLEFFEKKIPKHPLTFALLYKKIQNTLKKFSGYALLLELNVTELLGIQ